MRAYTVLEGVRDLSDPEGIIYQDESSGQTVFSGKFESFANVAKKGQVDGWIFDTPTIDDKMSPEEFFAWTSQLFMTIENLTARDAALILLPTNRRGGTFFKSSLVETTASLSRWDACREIIWDQESDYLRSKYPFRKITIFRRGNKPMRPSPLRYVDIIRGRPPKNNNEHDYAPIPEEILSDVMKLFDFNLICSPFAGTGSVAKAALMNGVSCISCELDHTAAHSLADTLLERTK